MFHSLVSIIVLRVSAGLLSRSFSVLLNFESTENWLVVCLSPRLKYLVVYSVSLLLQELESVKSYWFVPFQKPVSKLTVVALFNDLER